MTKTLTSTKKLKILSLLLERDGYQCLYCKKTFEEGNYIFEHLNNNRNDNKPENIVLAHQACNIEKISNSDYQIIAQEKLKENESKLFLREGNFHEESSSNEVIISRLCFNVVEERVTEVINEKEKYEYHEALYDCMYLCRKRVGNGSEQAIRRHLAALTASIADFKNIKEGKRKFIIKRMKD